MFLNNKGAGKGRILSPQYRSWRNAAGLILKSQRIKPIEGRFDLEIYLNDRFNGDCDNRIKPVCDLLVTMGIVQGDQKKYMRSVSVEWIAMSSKDDECLVSLIPVAAISGVCTN